MEEIDFEHPETKEDVVGSTCQSTIAAPRQKAVTSKKKRSVDGFSELVKETRKFRAAHQGVREDIRMIASFFRKEAEGNDRRMMLFKELMQLDGFSRWDMLDAGEHICKEAYRIDFFFSFPVDFWRDYVLKQLSECQISSLH